ncbi:succinylglutamate desuccinylase/aspartoacylase family protein [Chloroflexi bacterium TSY]|nr:succinylglutamate desuccinylase/aspartoacylase family protein [Chloroflexi bacterium TSY]
MKIGTIEAKSGEKAFGFLQTGETHAGFDVQIPLHMITGATDGPTLLVQAGLSGLEIEAASILPKLIDELDPAQIKGTLLVIPLMNTSGFEFEQVNAIWDNKDLTTLGRGDADGSVSEQLISYHYANVVAQADAVVDIRSGALWGYYGYAGVYSVGSVEESRGLAVAVGLPQVLIGQPEDGSTAQAAAEDGKMVVSAWIGGGPGLRDYRDENVRRTRNAVLNAMRHLGMLAGDLESETDTIAVIEAHTMLKVSGARGLTFMAKEKRGQMVAEGESIGYVRHPYTGETIQNFTASKAGVMLHAGAVWPMVPEDATLAILGDPVEEVSMGG